MGEHVGSNDSQASERTEGAAITTVTTAAPEASDTRALPVHALSPRCLGCGYTLIGLPESRCPECGRAFDLAVPSTYTFYPPFARWRYWMPGLILSIVTGLLLFMFVVNFVGWGWTATLVIPFCLGTLLGYGVRVRWVVTPLLALVLAGGLIFGLTTLQLTGVFCGLLLAGLAVGPILIGILVGFILRVILKTSRFDQRWHLPTLLAILVPLLSAGLERAIWTPPAVEVVRTSIVVDAPRGRAWDAMGFYEQAGGAEPWLFRLRRLGMPRPLYTSGSVARVGERTVCVYDKGRLVKEVTQREDGKRLAFKVVEQGFERHSMTLVGGSFTFDELDAMHTRVTVETTYRPHLGPRWAWQDMEQWTVHTLHGHVLAGIARKAR